MVTGTTLDSRGEVEHDWVLWGSFSPFIVNFIPEFNGKFGFSLREGLQAI